MEDVYVLLGKEGEGLSGIFTVPYSHMPDEDAELFYSTYGSLLAYANERLGVVERGRPLVQCDDKVHRLTPLGGHVSEALWAGHRSLVDDFVERNPYGLASEQLEVVRPWRWAVRDQFVCMGASADYVLLMNDDRAFAMGAMQDDAYDHVHAVPSLLLLTLLPFKRGIVCDGKTIFLCDKCREGAEEYFADQLHYLASRKVVSWAWQLEEYSKGLSDENRIPPDYQRQLDEALRFEDERYERG